MLWTCACCGYEAVPWSPKTWSEADISAVARARCAGRSPRALKGARGFVFLGSRYAADAPVRCPSCLKAFYPSDTLTSTVPRRRASPRDRGRLSLP